MPGRAKLKCALVAAFAVSAALVAAGCASTDHSWRDEFDARIEGATALIEENVGELQPRSSEAELLDAVNALIRPLNFKAQLIKDLDPPPGCKALQEEGAEKVFGVAFFTYDLPKNLTPYLHHKLPGPYEEAIAELRQITHEAETCE